MSGHSSQPVPVPGERPNAWGWDCPGCPPVLPCSLAGVVWWVLAARSCPAGPGETLMLPRPWGSLRPPQSPVSIRPFLARQERTNCSYWSPFCTITLCKCFHVKLSNCTETGTFVELFLNPLSYTEAFRWAMKLCLLNAHLLFYAAAAIYYTKGELSFPKWVTTKCYGSEGMIWGWSCPPSSKISHGLMRSLFLGCLVESVLLDTRT